MGSDIQKEEGGMIKCFPILYYPKKTKKQLIKLDQRIITLRINFTFILKFLQNEILEEEEEHNLRKCVFFLSKFVHKK